MKKWRLRNRYIYTTVILIATIIMTGCGRNKGEGSSAENAGKGVTINVTPTSLPDSGLKYESASDTEINFDALQADNDEIFGWLYIPQADVDAPILQSYEADDYYATHNAYKEEDKAGALYIELANQPNMCDFMTVIHGSGGSGGILSDLYQYTDPEYFDKNDKFYIYIDGNLLTYEIFAAYTGERQSLIRTYDFTYTEGCAKYLNDLYKDKAMDKIIREEWDVVTPYYYLVTLTVENEDSPDTQYNIVGALIHDAAGTIERAVTE